MIESITYAEMKAVTWLNALLDMTAVPFVVTSKTEICEALLNRLSLMIAQAESKEAQDLLLAFQTLVIADRDDKLTDPVCR